MASAGGSPRETVRQLTRLLDREGQRLDARRSELGEVRSALRALTQELSRGAVLPVSDLEVVPAEFAVDVVGGLLEEVGNGVVRTAARTVEYGPGLEDERIRDGKRRLADGLVVRAIYPLAALDTSTGRRWVTMWAEAGEDQRFVIESPSEFLVAGTSAVIACAQWNVADSDYVLFRDPMLVAAFTALHDAAFASGASLGVEDSASASQSRLIDLMALGLKDEAIARTLGWSLRTVRRRVAALLDEHGVETRFQLGAALYARGRLDAGPVLPPARRAPVSAARRR